VRESEPQRDPLGERVFGPIRRENPSREGHPAVEGEREIKRFDGEIRQRFRRERLSGEKREKKREGERERTGLWRRFLEDKWLF
jgi:hypothetical protein